MNKNNKPEETFGSTLATIRKFKGMTLEQMEEFIGVTASVISDLEYGRTVPSIKRAAFFTNKLGQSEQVIIRLSINDNFRKLGIKLEITPKGLKNVI